MLSIAMETSCRRGGLAVARDGDILACCDLGTTGRHAADLLPNLDALLKAQGATPADVDELYLSVGPGSFTGLRVGVTVARTWAQAQPALQIVAVPTALAVADALTDASDIGVLLASKLGEVWAQRFVRDDAGELRPEGDSILATPEQLLADWPENITLTGEAVGFVELPEAAKATIAPEALRYPHIQNVHHIGHRMARENHFTPWDRLEPLYARRPEALRLWELKNGE